MASVNLDWSRDHAADANPDLTRKRPRLSEEAEASPQSTDDDMVQIEALPVDDSESGNDISVAIELHDGIDTASFSSTLNLDPDIAPVNPIYQINFLLDSLANGWLNPRYFDNLSRWLVEHVKSTSDQSREGDVHQKYLDDVEFFGRLGLLCYDICQRPNSLFSDSDANEFGLDQLAVSVRRFATATITLAPILLRHLPNIVDSAVARRDSAQTAKTRQPIEFLAWVQILAQFVSLHRAMQLTTFFRYTFDLKPKTMAKELRRQFSDDAATIALCTNLLHTLSQYHREIENAWQAIDALLCFVHALDLGAGKDSESLLSTIHVILLPVICEKHPRALPDGFHGLLVSVALRLLDSLVQNADLQGVAALYQQYIRGDYDALCVEQQDDEDVAASLLVVSENSRDTVEALIKTAWDLHAHRSYIFSSIVDVRSHGVQVLGNRLLAIHQEYTINAQRADHPVAKYAARFLRHNEFTRYIFGPKSHTSLVKQSQHIVGYLAVTGEYTDQETDIIWDSCMNSVEAQFARATFATLMDISRYLDFDRVLHLAKKYTTTDPVKLGQDAVDFLTDIFQKLHLLVEADSETHAHDYNRLDTAFISVDLMMHVDDTDRTMSLSQLRETARLELFRFANTTDYQAPDRRLILEHCVPHIVNHSKYATTSIEIMAIFLQAHARGGATEEARALLGLLPIESMVDELVQYVTAQRDAVNDQGHWDLGGVEVRMDLFLRLWAKAGGASDEVLNSLFEHTVGSLAINNDARERVWQMLSITGTPGRRLIDRWLRDHVASLPADLVTPRLVLFLTQSIEGWAHSDAAQQNYSVMLSSPAWQKLVQLTESPSSTASMARDTICHVLFSVPKTFSNKTSITACHAQFAKLQIKAICSESTNMGNKTGEALEAYISSTTAKVGLLQSVLTRSQEHSSSYIYPQIFDVSLSKASEDETVYYSLEIYGGSDSQPKVVRANAGASTKTSELVAKLPSITGADDHRLIVAGKEIRLEERADSPLSDLGVQESGVISICPKHNIRSDLRKVLTMPGAVEQQIIEHYDELEALLEAPSPVASKISGLLGSISAPSHVRDKLSSPETPAVDLFPLDGMWRSMFYINALHQLLKDLARLGVADEAFVRQGVTLLVSCLCNDARSRQDNVSLRAIRVLTAFLQEKPAFMTSATLIHSPAELNSCLYRILGQALSLPENDRDLQHDIVMATLGLLQEASRQQPAVWQSFAEDSGVANLHAQILFECDSTLSTSAADSIKDFCIDQGTSDVIVDFYTNTILTILPQALIHSDRANDYFELATRLLLSSSTVRSDESRARTITDQLLATLCNYSHIESADLPVLDVVITGLLGLVSESVNVLRSFKKPLGLQGLAARLFREFLFVRGVGNGTPNDMVSRQLFHQRSRHAMYELVKTACDTKDDFRELLEAMLEPLQAFSDHPIHSYPGHKEYLRPPMQFSGLPNLGQTCYMNSLLQQLYANVPFRQFILDTPTPESEQQKLLQQMKHLFAWMQNSAQPVADTTAIATELGIDVSSQEDVHDFYASILSRLEKELPQQARPAFHKFYTGKMITQVKGECGHVSPRTEAFVDVPIVIKNKRNLAETLGELVQGEPMQGDNQYKCLACDPHGGGKLVDAMRRNCPGVIPDNLTFCLKRFEYNSFTGNEVKVNDRFEFPETIDMSRYHATLLDNPGVEIDQDVFDLVGVIVHVGCIGYGHYWSYTLLRDPADMEEDTWIRLEDQSVTTCPNGFADVAADCFGGRTTTSGHEASDNAYVLFYQRKKAPKAELIDSTVVRAPETQALLPPRVPFANDDEDKIRTNNEWIYRIAHLFDEQFSSLLEWVLARCKRLEFIVHAPTPDSSDVSSDAGSTKEAADQAIREQDDAIDEFAVLLSRVATIFIQRIAPCDPTPVKKLNIAFSGLSALFKDQPKLASCVLRDLINSEWFCSIIGHRNGRVCKTVDEFVWPCVEFVREHDSAYYGEVLGRLRRLHASMLRVPDRIAALDWATYLPFASRMASLSPADTAAVLDEGYWVWVFEMLHLPWDKALQSRYKGLADRLTSNPPKTSALYSFIVELLDHHLDIADASTFSPEDGHHLVRDGKVLLKQTEFGLLGHASPGSSVFSWIRTARFAEDNDSTQESMPGKLLSLLAEKSHLATPLRESIVQHIETEQHGFTALVNLALVYCVGNPSEENALAAFTALAKVAHEWVDEEGELLQIISVAFEAIPRVVLMTLEHWVLEFLLHKEQGVREPTAAFLKEHVFGADADLTQTDLVAVRARLAARLARVGAPRLHRAYNEEQSKNRFESLIEVYRLVGPYLQSLRDSVNAQLRSNDGNNSISQELLVEHDRAAQTLESLQELGTVLQDWESDPSPSNLPTGVVRSREEGSEEYGSDVSADWDSADSETL